MCGKNYDLNAAQMRLLGSPPRVREKPRVTYPMRSPYRITPACAGKTRARNVIRQVLSDHPRVCGKNSSTMPTWSRLPGSPPRVREKLNTSLVCNILIRITPACAGKTTIILTLKKNMRDHPRVCGKNDAWRVRLCMW